VGRRRRGTGGQRLLLLPGFRQHLPRHDVRQQVLTRRRSPASLGREGSRVRLMGRPGAEWNRGREVASTVRSSVTFVSPGCDRGLVARLRREAALSSALGTLRGYCGGGGSNGKWCEGVVRCGGAFIGGRRASGGAGRWRRPTSERGLASSRGTVMTSAGWRQQEGEPRRCACLRGEGGRSKRRARLASARVRGSGFQDVYVGG
jgi:hypothetical protein